MHIMIDLETLSLDKNAVITQIGWCLFEPEVPGGIFDSGCCSMNIAEQIRNGRNVSWDTMAWWMLENEEARKLLVQKSNSQSMTLCLDDFINRFDWHQDSMKGVWSNGLLFDLVILQNCFEFYKRRVPWHYRAPRDFKTIRSLRPHMASNKPAIAHSAEHDAIAQALDVQEVMHSLLNETGV